MVQKFVLTNAAVEHYLNCDYTILKELKTISFFKKLKNEKEIRKISEQLMYEIRPYSIKDSNKLNSEESKEVKEIFTSHILKIDEKRLFFNKPPLLFKIKPLKNHEIL